MTAIIITKKIIIIPVIILHEKEIDFHTFPQKTLEDLVIPSH